MLGEATIQELREAVRGEVFTPGSDGYEEARRSGTAPTTAADPRWSSSCTGAADVIAAVGFARSNDLPIAVRGGGHSIAGFSTFDDGIVIDLAPMNGVRVDPAARRATVGGGAVWADVDHETQAHGLATTGGLVSSTGVAGFTLGGGIGWTDAQVRPRLRQPRRRRRRHRRRHGSSTRARPRTPTCSGACAAAAATSAS